MSNPNIKIIGGGLAGLIAAHHFKNANVFEAGPRMQMHNALLRFRGDDVSKITGIPFRKVRVYKEIYWHGKTYQGKCPMAWANLYAKKVTGKISGRSIMKLDEADRFIAPDDFYDQMVDRLLDEGRLFFNCPVSGEDIKRTQDGITGWINTAPLHIVLAQLGDTGLLPERESSFDRAPIAVHRYKICTPCDVYQTIYFPSHNIDVYRASITGDTLIVESINAANVVGQHEFEMESVLRAFGLVESDIDWESETKIDQKYGKIVDMDEKARQAILFHLTDKHNIFSLGRFATWRNILLDDVAADLPRIEKMMMASDYMRNRIRYLEN